MQMYSKPFLFFEKNIPPLLVSFCTKEVLQGKAYPASVFSRAKGFKVRDAGNHSAILQPNLKFSPLNLNCDLN